MLNKKLVPILLTSCLIGVSACGSNQPPAPENTTDADQLPGTGITVRPSNSDWLEEQFVTEIVNIGLEELGYDVEEVQQADYSVLNLSLANGDMDFTTGFYSLGHEDFFENAGGEEKLEKIDPLVVGGGVQSIMVDKLTADTYGISSIEQLQDPEIAKLFDADADGKADLFGCQVGWGCSRIIDHFIEVYELNDTVVQIQGAYTALLADVTSRIEQQEPTLFYAYSPHWILIELKPDEDIVPLTVPFTSTLEDQDPLTEADTTVDGKNLGFAVSPQMLLASQTFVDENPVARKWFEQVKIPAADVNAESLRLRDGEDSPEDIRRHAETWVADNRDLFDSWLEATLEATN